MALAGVPVLRLVRDGPGALGAKRGAPLDPAHDRFDNPSDSVQPDPVLTLRVDIDKCRNWVLTTDYYRGAAPGLETMWSTAARCRALPSYPLQQICALRFFVIARDLD